MPSAKQKITLAAKDLFVAKGYNGTSIRDIAKTSGVQTSLIYHYFENKDCLWRQVRETFIGTNDLLSHTTEIITTSLESFIEQLIQQRLDFFKNNHEILRIFDWQRLEGQGERMIGVAQKKNAPTPVSLEQILQNFQQMGEINPDISIKHMALMISGAIFGPFLKTGQNELKTEEEEVQYIKMLTQSLVQAFKP